MSYGPILALGFCLVVSVLALRRAYQLWFWPRHQGEVIGPADSSADSSHVRIRFVDSAGVKHEFTSGVSFGANSRTPSSDRIPFAPGDTVTILVNPNNPEESELFSKMLFSVPVALLLLTMGLAYSVFNAN